MLAMGKFQHYKLVKVYSINQTKSELETRGLSEQFNDSNDWLNLPTILKIDEKENKVIPLDYPCNYFKWNSSYFDDGGTILWTKTKEQILE